MFAAYGIVFGFFFFFFPKEGVARFLLLSGLLLAGVTYGLVLTDRHLKGRPRVVAAFAMFLVLVLGVRGVLFHGAEVWEFYIKKLPHGTTSDRQFWLLSYNARMAADPAKKFFLAVGSSQVRVLFGGKDVSGKYDLGKVHFSALRPEEYLFLKDYILRESPSCVLLYMSLYEFSFLHQAEGLMELPVNLPYLIRLMGVFKENDYSWKNLDSTGALVAGQFMPELKYRYIFRKFWDEFVEKRGDFSPKETLPQKTLPPPDPQEKFKARLEMEAGWCSDIQKNFKIQAALLNDFIEFCADRNMKIVILEGQTRLGLLQDGRVNAAKEFVRNGLAALAAVHKNVLFVPLQGQYQFQADEYKQYDSRHVKDRAVERYLEQLAPFLNSIKKGHGFVDSARQLLVSRQSCICYSPKLRCKCLLAQISLFMFYQ